VPAPGGSDASKREQYSDSTDIGSHTNRVSATAAFDTEKTGNSNRAVSS
jgi:hypothetical protein